MIFFAAVLPQFVDPSGVHPSVQMLLFGAVFTVMAFLMDSCWALGAGAAREWFARSAGDLQRHRRGCDDRPGCPARGHRPLRLTGLVSRSTLSVGAGKIISMFEDASLPAGSAVEFPPVGAGSAAVLARFDAGSASAYDLVEAAAGWARLAAWVAAGEAAALAELAGRPELRPTSDSGCRSVNPVTNTALEIAARTHTTARQAENLVGHSLQLVEDFPDTWAALSAGLIDLRRARVITDELGGQESGVRARVEAAVLPVAPGLDSVALRKLIKRLLHELAPVETAERVRAAREGRYVSVTPASDGMAFLEALLPAEDATALNTVLNVAAADAKRADAARGAPVRSKDQRRADALAEFAWAALSACADGITAHAAPAPTTPAHTTTTDTAGAAGTGTAGQAGAAAHGDTPTPTGAGTLAHGTAATTATGTAGAVYEPSGPGAGAGVRRRPVSVHVTVPFATVAGLGDEPGDLDGYGPIPAHIARELATAGVWTWLTTDPGTGHLLDIGAKRYRPTKALADFIVARDRTCRAPGCHRVASGADLDHIVPFHHGGSTTRDNVHALCETHHLLKHRGRWSVARGPDGVTHWTSPTGHRYRKPPG